MILEIKKKFFVNGGSFDNMIFAGDILLKIENERVKKKSLLKGTF
ncbi:hypothetical protein [Sporocytophaga myxococcoides]|nr:hypothetical protein [Sporocytophaga myxococcoides]